MQEIKLKFQKEQASLITECKRGLERFKLELWSLTAELHSAEKEYSSYTTLIKNLETEIIKIKHTQSSFMSQAKQYGDSLTRSDLKFLREIHSPSPLIEEISITVCSLLGYVDSSWGKFRRIIKDYDLTQQALKDIDVDSLGSMNVKKISIIQKKHNLHVAASDFRIPPEMSLFVNWMIYVINYALQEKEWEKGMDKLNEYLVKCKESYLELTELTYSVIEVNSKIENVLKCIESADCNIKNLLNCESDELHSVIQGCHDTHILLKNEMNYEGEPTLCDKDIPSLIMESLLISHNLSIDNYLEHQEEHPEQDSMQEPTPLISMVFDSQEPSAPDKRLISNSMGDCKSKVKKSKRKCCCFA